MLKNAKKYTFQSEQIRKLFFKDSIFILKFNIFNTSIYCIFLFDKFIVYYCYF